MAMLTIRQATAADQPALLTEYMQWVRDGLAEAFGVQMDVAETVAREMDAFECHQPPEGRLLLAVEDGDALGHVCLHRLRPGVAELKRLYVRPDGRRRGVGRALVRALLDEARAAGYERVLLDSPPFAVAAQALYRTLGFRDTAPYPDTQIPPASQARCVFMERLLL
jgi:ribosomal protein S18 acetylase RimI-like enzyme